MKRNEDFHLRNAGGEFLIVPLGAQVADMGGLVILNETGSYVWTLLQKEQSLDDLVNAVAERFAVERARAYADVQCFTADLVRMGILA